MASLSAESLQCPHCAAPLAVHPRAGWIICAYCGAHLRVVDEDGKRGLALDDAPEREEVGIPERFHVERLGSRLSIRWRWFTWAVIPLLFFCIAWDSFLVFWYSMALGGSAPWIFLVFPIAHVAVGVVLTYATLAGFLNSTRVEVGQGLLKVAHGPLPCFKNQVVESADVEQLFCTHEPAARSSDGNAAGQFKVMARTRSGKNVKLVPWLTERGQALYLEQEIERHLGIANRPVPGELPR